MQNETDRSNGKKPRLICYDLRIDRSMPDISKSLITVQPMGGFDQPLTYRAKLDDINILKIGSLVKIPLGKRQVMGIVWSLNSPDIGDQLRFAPSTD